MDANLGTNFVPNSPEITAAKIAGPDAIAEAAALAAAVQNAPPAGQLDPGAAAAGKGQPDQAKGAQAEAQAAEGQAQGEGEGKADQASQGKGRQIKPGGTSASAAGGTSKSGSPSENQDATPSELQLKPGPQAGDSQTGSDGQRQAEGDPRKFKEEPWVAKLPPELRKAMRAKSQRRAPRGYEERLQRYFENVD